MAKASLDVQGETPGCDASDLSAFWAAGHGWGPGCGGPRTREMSATSSAETQQVWVAGTKENSSWPGGLFGCVEIQRQGMKKPAEEKNPGLSGSLILMPQSLTVSDSGEVRASGSCPCGGNWH